MLIEVTLGVIGGSTLVGYLVRQLANNLHSSNPKERQQAALYQQLLDVGSSPLSSLHQRNSYYSTRSIEKEQARIAILQEIQGKQLDLRAYYNEVESKVLELKSTYLDLKEIKIDIELGRKLQEIEFRENALEIKDLTLANKESLFALQQQNFEIVKNRELLSLQQKAFDLDKIAFSNDQQKQLLELNTQRLDLDKYSLQLVGKTLKHELLVKEFGLNYQRDSQALKSQQLQLERLANQNTYHTNALSLDRKRLDIDRKQWQLDRDRPIIPLQSVSSTSSLSDDWEEMKEIMRAERYEKERNKSDND